MARSKAKRTTLPSPIPTLPNGTLNTPPESPSAEIFTGLEIHNAAVRAEREKQELERAEEILHELAIIWIRNQSQGSDPPRTRQSKRVKQTQQQIARQQICKLIASAASEAGMGRGSGERFCTFLHRYGVPVPSDWPVTTWKEAWKTEALRPEIRSFKSRYSIR